MECLLIFDHLNDIIFSKYNEKFAEHINKFAALEGLHNNAESENRSIHNDIIIQVFSPIITSQRIMNCQFGNSYTSIQCDDGLNLCFDEYMGYLFVSIGETDVSEIKHFLRISVTIVRYLCGPDVCQLKNNESTAEILTTLIDTWLGIKESDQAMLVEAIEPLCVNSDITNTTKQALQKSINKLTANVEHKKMHGIILVENKFLAISSSPNTKELSVSDVLFSILLSSSMANKQEDMETKEEDLCSRESYDLKIHSFQALLAGSEFKPGCLSHVIHIIQISKNINLLYLLEVGNAAVSAHLYETFCYLHAMQLVQIQKDVETLRPIFESMDTTVKRLCDALKKVKTVDIENSYKQLAKKWDVIRKKYMEFIKNNSDEALLRAETLILGFLENLKHLLALTSVDETVLLSTQECAMEAARMVGEQLEIYRDFLEVKAIKNLSLGSRDSLTINKYLEEFPGLVHFIYVDRNSHRIIAPTLDFNSDDTSDLTKRKIWTMISFVRNHLQEGCLSLMWKDSVFNYSYFLWFEDPSGTSVKPVIFPTNSSKALPLPGLFGSIFYQKLKEICFPKTQPAKIRCFEIYCIHLGLVTASCVLEHSRRLAATVCELRGQPSSTIDLL